MVMAERAQSLQKHTRFLPGFHFFVVPVLLINVVNAIRLLWMDPNGHYAFQVLVAIALLMTAFLSRVQSLAAQDRVIRLEMRLRLRGLLPPDMHTSIDGLTTRQLVALRFAGDAEMADIVRDVLAGKLATQKDIKSRVKNWQADWQRV
jgi:hypothetical protein